MALSIPDRDQRAFREPSHGLRLVLICALSITLMVLDNRNEHLKDVRKLLTAATYPILVVIDAPFALGRWVQDSVRSLSTLQSENETLNRALTINNARVQRLAALEAENIRLRALLDSTAKVGDRVLIAEIMSVDMDPFRHRIVVNKGSYDGVAVGQAMIDADGIVGQITRDQVFSAEAILITDIDHALPVELVRNRLRTIAVGTGELDRLSLPFLPRNADVQDGDLLVTSGLGGTFPPGYPVGIVSDVQSEAGEPFLAISAEPSAALNRIREVLLIYPGTGTPAAMPAKPDSDLQTEPDRTSGEESPVDENISNPAPEENSPEEETSDEEETSADSSGSSGDET
jgi:rod shape-determining protein MreC